MKDPDSNPTRQVDNHLPLLTAVQTAERLNVTEATLAKWRCKQTYDLPFVKIGRSVRYNPADLNRFIQSRTVQRVNLKL